MTDHLRPTASIAPAALLPGDPGRALALAQALLEEPRMANHARGLWGYTATTPGGAELTIQSTGIGGPSVTIVVAELAQLGVARAVRLGTCRALDPALVPGALVVAETALEPGDSGPCSEGRLRPDAGLTAALTAADRVEPVTVAGTDDYYDPRGTEREETWRTAGARVVDLGTTATLATGRRLGIAVASALVVTRAPGAAPLADEEIERASLELGRLASAALGG